MPQSGTQINQQATAERSTFMGLRFPMVGRLPFAEPMYSFEWRRDSISVFRAVAKADAAMALLG